MRKYDVISALSEETSKRVARNEESWKKYLNTASRLYKYPFKDQLLIYAQRPDATACASIEIWNEKMHCWVNKGAKGIALLDEEGSPYTGLRYVFDISDVHKARRIGRFPQLWEMREEHQEAVLNRLEGIYGDTNKNTGFVDRIREIASRIAQDCYGELASDMEYLKEGSFLEELDELNIAVRVRETLADSIAYTVLKRCGMEDAELAEEIQFPYIHEFNTIETLSHIGDSISDLSKPVLMEIGKAIGAYDREIAGKEAARNFAQKGLANTSDTRYNALKRESETEDVLSTTQTGNAGERGNNDESDLRKERGLHDTDVKDGRAAGGDAHEIRADEEELLTGTQEGDLHRASAEREAERASSDHSGAGGAEDGTADRADDEAGGSDGKAQGREPDALGSEDEQHQTLGGGNRAEGTGIQPVSEEATENKELTEPGNGESALSGFSLSGIEKGILQFDEFMVHKCPEIAGVMLFEPDKDKQTEYIKNSYRHKEFTEFYVGEERAGYRADENGLTVWKGSYLNRTAEATVSWETVRDSIALYMEKGEYLKEGQIPQWEEPKETEVYQQLSLFPTIEEQIGTIEAAQAGEKYTMPAAFSLPKEQLEAILRTGGGRDNSRSRIYAKYQQGKTPEEMAVFLKNEYRTTGKGFDFGSNPISVWFNESGMSIGYGMSAKENPVAVMGWQEIEGVVRSMVENGFYMGANEVFLVDAVERQRVSNDLFNFFRDGIGEIPENIPIKTYNHPESMTNLCELLSTQEGRDVVAGELSHAKEQIDAGEKQIRWRYVKKPEHLLSEIADLSTERTEYPVQDSVEVLHEDFITQDEIDERLTGGSNYHHGQFRIYEYFMEGHDKKENIAFLKNEYGTGGGSPALIGSDRSDEWHDSKGIKLGKGRIGVPYAKVLLKWNVVEKRIRELVNADKYLTPKGKEAFAQYKIEQAEEAMRREQEKLEHGVRVECKDAIEKAIAEKFDGYILPRDTAEGVIRQYGKERVEIVLANTITHLSHDGRFSPNNKEWAKSLVPSADWQTRDYIVTSHPAVLDGFTNQARRFIERDREPEKMTVPEQEAESKASESEKALIERLAEMSAVVKICGALSMKDVVGWNEDTGAVAIEDADRRLEGKAVYDTLFLEAADYVLMQSLSGNAEKAVEMDALLKEAQKYAARYEDEPGQQREGHAAEISEAEPAGERREEPLPDAEPEKRTEEPEQEETVRFTVTETSDAFTEPYAVWDSETQDYFTTGDGTVPTFDTPEEADVFCQNLNGDLQGKEAENIVAEETEQPGTEDVSGTKDSAEKDDFPDIDTQAVREGLEKAGIVDGQLVDETALENDPFIRQVMGDVETLTGGSPPEPEKASQKQPEIDKTGAVNYHISFNEAENTGKGFAPKEKFRQNVEAIRTLETIEGERRTATPEEQEILAKYVGWGGLADAFDSSKANWANEYQELKSLLSPEEYASARESTLNAHYTSPVIIQAISTPDSGEYETIKIADMQSEVANVLYAIPFLEENEWNGNVLDYLQERGFEFVPIMRSGGLNDGYPQFYDFDVDMSEWEVHTASELPATVQAEQLINRMEFHRSVYDSDERNLIMNHAYKLDDMYKTTSLAHSIAEQKDDSALLWETIRVAQEEIDALPDGMVGLSEMHEYGYSWDEMLPLTKDMASELFGEDVSVYQLHADGSETLVEDRAALQEHDGLFGVEKGDWNAYKEYQSMKQELEDSEPNREAQLLYGNEGRFGIYQLKDSAETRDIRFMDMDYLEKEGIPVSRENYTLVYTGELKEGMSLEDIYTKFNIDHPADFTGHSLSVSDVVVLHQDGENTSHYVDSVGYREIPEFTKELSISAEISKEEAPVMDDVAEMPENTVGSGIQEELGTDKFTYYVIEDLSARVGSNPEKGEVERFGSLTEAIGRFKECREREDTDQTGMTKAVFGFGINGKEFDVLHVKNNQNCVPLEFTQNEVENSRFKSELQALYQEVGFDRAEVYRERLPEETKDLVKELFEFQLKTSGINDVSLYMDRFDALYEQGKMEHLIPEGDQNRILENIPFTEWKNPYIDASARETDRAETELAFRLADRYISIQEATEGYDYTIYDMDYRELDGGVYDNPNITIRQALDEIVTDLKEPAHRSSLEGSIRTDDELIPIDYDGLIEKAEQAEKEHLEERIRTEVPEAAESKVIADFKARTEELFNPVNGQTQEDIEMSVYAYLQSKIDEYGMDIELVDMAVSGSRCRGLEEAVSDLDVAVEYRGGENEDTLFNAFNEDGFTIGGVKVDINPITEGKTGTLGQYLPGVEAYLAEKRAALQEKAAGQAQEEKHTVVTLTVAECGEFHNFGEYHEGIASIEEAIAIFNQIPPERMNGIPSIGINIHTEGTESYEDTQMDIVSGRVADLEILDYVPDITDNPKAVEVIAELIDKLPDIEVRGSLEKWQAAFLAAEIDQLSYDFDTYQYNHTVEDREAQIANITEDIRNGNTGYLDDFLNALISDSIREGMTDIVGKGTELNDSEGIQTARKAKELLDRLAEYKPLAKVEELEECNYNMIDNVLNNEKPKEEKEKQSGRISIKEKLAEKKAVIEQRDKSEKEAPEKGTEKKSEREM